MDYAVLFVCMGNICRSPTAEAVFKKLSSEKLEGHSLVIESAGTIGYHQGEHPDPRAIAAGKLRDYELSTITAREVKALDFARFDLILAMDKDNYLNLKRLARTTNNRQHTHKIRRFLEFATQQQYQDVPDPYYGGSRGFDLVIDLVEDASKGLIEFIKQSQG